MPSRVGLICVPRSRRTSSTLGGDRDSTICGVQTDSGQEIGDATSGEGASRQSEENSGGWPIQGRRSGSCRLGRREEGERKERRNRQDPVRLGQSLGRLLAGQRKRVNACLGRFAQDEVFLEAAGFVSPELETHVGSGTGLGWRKGERAQ